MKWTVWEVHKGHVDPLKWDGVIRDTDFGQEVEANYGQAAVTIAKAINVQQLPDPLKKQRLFFYNGIRVFVAKQKGAS